MVFHRRESEITFESRVLTKSPFPSRTSGRGLASCTKVAMALQKSHTHRIFANERLTDLYFGTAGRPAEAASC